MSISDASANVSRLKVRVVVQNILPLLILSQEAENQLHGYAHAADDRFASEDFGVNCDAFEQVFLRHESP